MSILLDALKKSQKDQQEIAQAAAESAAKKAPEQSPASASAAVAAPESSPTALREPFVVHEGSPAASFKFTSLIFPAVCVLLAAIVYVGFGSRGEKEEPADHAVSTVPAPAQSTAKPDAMPVSLPAPALPKVEGIVWDPDAPLAILAGRPVKVGDSAAGWTVQKITANQVNISRDGVSETLTLPEIPAART